VRLGVAYYPEHWPRERWDVDFPLMRDAGLDVLRIGEFAWSVLEPSEGRYDFSLFDAFVERAGAEGFVVVLGTPTATPPAWLVAAYPEVLPVDEQRRALSFGGRRHYCFNSPAYHDLSRRIVARMAERYAGVPHVVGWQIDNEFGHKGTDRCYCARCQSAFHAHLRETYGTLDALNRRWGADFWSQRYTAWEQVPLPWPTPAVHHPSLLLEFLRFRTASVVRYQRAQAEILRRTAPRQWITTNIVPWATLLDYHALARDLDLISMDNYPVWGTSPEPLRPWEIALRLDMTRGAKDGRAFWVMEQLVGAQGWDRIGYLPRPGQVRLWTLQSVAHGAEAIVYFNWRACRWGQEQWCYGVLDHDGIPGRRYREVQAVTRELGLLGDALAARRPRGDTALVLSYENQWAWTVQPHSTAFEFKAEMNRFYGPLFRANLAVDVLDPSADLAGYPLVVAPLLHVVEPDLAGRLARYVEAGGTLVLTYRSGVKDRDNVVTDAVLPGLLRPLAGVRVEEVEALQTGQAVPLVAADPLLGGTGGEGRVWCDVLALEGARTLATYGGRFYAGRPAITLNAVGRGRVVYVGTAASEALLDALVAGLVRDLGLDALATPPGIEATRVGAAGEHLVLLNHEESGGDVDLPPGYVDAVTGAPAASPARLAPLEVRVLRKGAA
jgi:beta-galactosidase